MRKHISAVTSKIILQCQSTSVGAKESVFLASCFPLLLCMKFNIENAITFLLFFVQIHDLKINIDPVRYFIASKINVNSYSVLAELGRSMRRIGAVYLRVIAFRKTSQSLFIDVIVSHLMFLTCDLMSYVLMEITQIKRQVKKRG